MPNTIELLREIQRIDLQIGAIVKEEEQYRANLDGSGAELGGMASEVEAIEAEVAGMTSQKKEKEELVRQNNERIAKDQTRLSEIKNDKQYKAVNKEISNAEKSNKLIGMEMDSLLERLSEKEAELSGKQGELGEKDAALGGMKEGLLEKEGQWVKSREALDGERAEIAKDLKPAILKRYERIKSKRGGIGIANVKDETCLGCYIQIPAQTYNHLLRGDSDIIDCPHCHRILYYAAQVEEEAAPESPEACSEEKVATGGTTPETPAD